MATEQANVEVKQVNPKDVIKKVVVHPLVLLSVVDHFNRMSKIGNQKRVAGVLLGSIRNKVLDVANSFAGNTLYSLITLLTNPLFQINYITCKYFCFRVSVFFVFFFANSQICNYAEDIFQLQSHFCHGFL